MGKEEYHLLTYILFMIAKWLSFLLMIAEWLSFRMGIHCDDINANFAKSHLLKSVERFHMNSRFVIIMQICPFRLHFIPYKI